MTARGTITNEDNLSRTLAALADPTRREILKRLKHGEATVSELADPFDITMPAITKHLKVLGAAGLIERGRESRWRPARLNALPLKEVADWLDEYRSFWETRLDQLDDYLKTMKEKEP